MFIAAQAMRIPKEHRMFTLGRFFVFKVMSWAMFIQFHLMFP